MPKTTGGKLALGIAAIALAPFTGGASTFFYSLGANMILAGVAQRLTDKNLPQNRQKDGIKFNFQGEENPLYLVFGQHRVGGHISVLGTSGTSNKYLHIGVTHSAACPAGMADITDIWLDERKIDDTEIGTGPGGGYGSVVGNTYYDGIVQIARYLGTDSETADAVFDANISYQDAASYGRGLARTHIRLEKIDDDEVFRKAFPRGIPQLTALIQGRCYDPRLDSTNGGTGTHRADDPDTWTFSQNPAVILGTYMIMAQSDGGWGLDPSRIDWTVLSASANRCDDLVTRPDNSGGTLSAARHTCNIVLDTADGCFENAEKILTAMDGVMCTGLDRKIKVIAGEYETPTTTIDASWLRDGNVAIELDRPDSEIWNAVRARYIEPSVGYQQVSCVPYRNATYETADGRQEWKDLELPATTDRYEAQYLCAIEGRKSRHQKTAVLPLNYKGMDVEIWENVTLDLSALGLSGTFKVINWKHEVNGPVVTLLEQNADTWDSDIADYEETVPEPPPGLIEEEPPTPTGLTATATADGIYLKWDALGPEEYAAIVIEAATTSGGALTEVARVKGSFYIHALTSGETRYYKIKAQSALGKDTYSDYTAEVSATAKTVANGADVTADNTAGRGVNCAHPRYSGFGESALPPIDTSGNTVTLISSASAIGAGVHAVRMVKSNANGVSSYAFFGSSTTDFNLRLQPGKKYIVSYWARCLTAETVSISPRLRRSSDSSYIIGASHALTATLARSSFVADLSSDASGTTYVFNVWNTNSDLGTSVYVSGVMIEEQYGNQTTPSAYAPPAGMPGESAVAAASGRLTDQRATLAIVNGNLQNSLVSVASGSGLLEGRDGGLSATMRLKACTIQYGFGQVSYNQADATGLDFDEIYHGYASDPGLQGGTITLLATQSRYTPQSDQDYVYFGFVTMPIDGSGPTDGGGGAFCVVADAWLNKSLQARDATPGDVIDCWDDGAFFHRQIASVGSAIVVPCVRITSESGAVLSCSLDTPITQPDGRSVLAANIVGGKTLVEQSDGSFAWERVTREWIGERMVMPISVGGISFAASDVRDGRRIITHNIDKGNGL